MEKNFNYSMDEIKNVYSSINDMFALEGLSEDDEDDLDDYDPEDDIDDVDDDDDVDEDEDEGDESEIDDDYDPAEDEDDEYDDVVENVGIANMSDFLTIDEMDVEDLIKTDIAEAAVEAVFGAPDDINPAPADKNTSVRIKDFVSVLDPRPDFEDKSADDILDAFEDEFLYDEDDE